MSKNKKRKEESIYEKIERLRNSDTDFNFLISEIESKLEKFISEKNSIKSYHPKNSSDFYVNFKVQAVPLTSEQKNALLRYLDDKYIHSVKGNIFTLKKCWFSSEYRFKSEFTCYDCF